MDRVAKATGARVQTTVNGLDPAVLGTCSTFEERQVGARSRGCSRSTAAAAAGGTCAAPALCLQRRALNRACGHASAEEHTQVHCAEVHTHRRTPWLPGACSCLAGCTALEPHTHHSH